MAAVVSEDETSSNTRKEELPIDSPADSSLSADAKNLLLDLPIDNLLQVLSNLQPKEIDGVRIVTRALKSVIDEKKTSLPRHRASISIEDGSDDSDIVITELLLETGNWPKGRIWQEIPLACTDVASLVPALIGEPSDLFPAPLYPILRPSLLLTSVHLGCAHDYDSPESTSVRIFDVDIVALNNVLPPSTSLFFSGVAVHDVTYNTLKAVVAKRELAIVWCAMPRWEEQTDARPVSSNLLTLNIRDDEDINEDNRFFVRAVLALSTRIEFWYFGDAEPERELVECMAKTAEFVQMTYGPMSEACLLILAGVSRIRLDGWFGSEEVTTASIRKIVQKYLENGRAASASISLADRSIDRIWEASEVAPFYPLSSGYFGNATATQDEQRERKDTCLNGDVFLFSTRFMSVSVKCTGSRSFKIEAWTM